MFTYREMHAQAMEKMLSKLDMTQGDYKACAHPRSVSRYMG